VLAQRKRHHDKHREELLAAQREYKVENRDDLLTKRREYEATPEARKLKRARDAKRNAAKIGIDHEPYDREAIFERDHWLCKLCLARGESRRKARIPRHAKWPHPLSATIDHIIPKGPPYNGPDTPRNVQAAHSECNTRKQQRAANEQLLMFG
jgi:5-methylcytosine-specific restriction endonuclease McrA